MNGQKTTPRLPNFVIVAMLGTLYVHFGELPPVRAIFYGVTPAVIALILHSCYRLAKLGMEDALQWDIAGACLVITVALQAEVAILFIAAGIIGILYYGTRKPRSGARAYRSILGLLGALAIADFRSGLVLWVRRSF